VASSVSIESMTALTLQVWLWLVSFHKYYEFKNHIELLPFSKAVLWCKESFNEAIQQYRSLICRP